MKITLSSASADVLARVSSLRRWSVAPTMTRGSKAVGQELTPDLLVTENKAGKNKEKGNGKVVKMHIKKPKIKAAAPSKPVVAVGDISAENIRRNNNGRAAVLELMNELMELDEQTFPSAPAFDPEGICKMPFEGAKNIKKQMIVDAAPMAFEAMPPGYVGKEWKGMERNGKEVCI